MSISASPAGRPPKSASGNSSGRRKARLRWIHPFALRPDTLGRTALNRRLRVSDSAINVGMDAVLPESCRLINQFMTDRHLLSAGYGGLILTCGMPAGRPRMRPPVGRGLCLPPLDTGLRRAQAPSKPGRPHGERLGAAGRRGRAVRVARGMRRSARYGSGITGCQQADGAVAVPAVPAAHGRLP
jgi:hypothetical protein